MKTTAFFHLYRALEETDYSLESEMLTIPIRPAGSPSAYREYRYLASGESDPALFREKLQSLEAKLWDEVAENETTLAIEAFKAGLLKLFRKVAELTYSKIGDVPKARENWKSKLELAGKYNGNTVSSTVRHLPYTFYVIQTDLLTKISLDLKQKLTFLEEFAALKAENDHTPFQSPIEWKGKLNVLCTLFFDLLEKGYIDESKADMERWIVQNFTFTNEEIKPETVRRYLNASKGAERAKQGTKIEVPNLRK